MPLQKIISGGQSGADRAALDAAIKSHFQHGGWCPRGRLAEDGRIREIYQLVEMDSSDYRVRTEQNVLHSDGTVIFSFGTLKKGSALTKKYCRIHLKPCLHINAVQVTKDHALDKVLGFVDEHPIYTLNVAGQRLSSESRIYDYVYGVILKTLCEKKHKKGLEF